MSSNGPSAVGVVRFSHEPCRNLPRTPLAEAANKRGLADARLAADEDEPPSLDACSLQPSEAPPRRHAAARPSGSGGRGAGGAAPLPAASALSAGPGARTP